MERPNIDDDRLTVAACIRMKTQSFLSQFLPSSLVSVSEHSMTLQSAPVTFFHVKRHYSQFILNNNNNKMVMMMMMIMIIIIIIIIK